MTDEVIEFGGDRPRKTTRKVAPPAEPTAEQQEDTLDLDQQLATQAERDAAFKEAMKKRSFAAANMRLSGYSYAAIASTLDFASPRAARQAVTEIIASAYEVEDHSTLRAQESARLDRLLSAVWTKAIDKSSPDQLQFNRRASEIIEQHSKLHGLNAPAVLALVNPGAEEFNRVVEELHRAQTGEVAEEGDFLELTERPDGTFEEEDGYDGGE